MITRKLPIPYKKHGKGKCINQKLLQVSRTRKEEKTNPFKTGDPHPTHDVEFKSYHPYYGQQQWVSIGWVEAKYKKDNERKKARRKNDPEWAKAQDAKENQAKRDKMGEEAFLEYMRRHSREHYKKNPDYHAEKANRYHKRVREMYEKLPEFLKKEVDEIYSLRRQLNEAAVGAGMYGKGANNYKRYAFAVDHVMPLKPSKIKFKGKWRRPYMGLHTPWNLQILEAAENMSKSNRASPSEH
tara:strand:- start:82 stop:804 length:723 start_codon:yes stop_codon:yes gene_type:complete